MSSRSNLTKQSVSAVKWSALGNIPRYGLQLGAQIVLARLFRSKNYGLFALGMTVLAFSNMLANFGLAWDLDKLLLLLNEMPSKANIRMYKAINLAGLYRNDATSIAEFIP